MTAPTPMMEQYLRIKSEHADCLLFFRMGDFYELFFDDAVAASAALDIALTHRGKHQGADVSMCGVPVHSHEGYVARLIRKGFKVAICEQTEDPAAARNRGSKSVVERAVVRVVTAGTLTEDNLLAPRTNNYLAALAGVGTELSLAWIDISTGVFCVQSVLNQDLGTGLAGIDPRELLLPESGLERFGIGATVEEWKDVTTFLPATRFDSINGRQRLLSHYAVATLDAFGHYGRAEVAAAGALLDYVDLTQKGCFPRLSPPRRVTGGDHVQIDPASRRNLELFLSLSGEEEGSLLHNIDVTITGGGGRLLRARLASPLTSLEAIQNRHDQVAFFVAEEKARTEIRSLLCQFPDIERSLSRLSMGRGGPRDLAAVERGLSIAQAILDVLAQGYSTPQPVGLTACIPSLVHLGDLIEEIDGALGASLPLMARDGDFIAEGYAPELDELRKLRDRGRQHVAELQATYTAQTGISSLKIRHNNVLGYFIEVPAKQADRITSSEGGCFILRQSMANAMRFATSELGDLEQRIATAAEQALKLELSLFDALVARVTAEANDIALTASAIAALDVSAALSEIAVDRDYCRPQLEHDADMHIIGGRHPVVESALRKNGGIPFMPNDCRLCEGQRMWLITGPNMAGKSTFLRQTAVIVLLAQMGSFVPARSARMGIVDRVFSRVGAADDLARGRSTFMVEMVETAAILNQATARALVILDEIGRGTATFDGLSIAWAVVEYLHDINRCRALFATHYHELTALAATLGDLACYSMRVREWRGDIVFLHEIAPGASNRSYGIHVGRLAGLPKPVVQRAEEVLTTLEKGEAASAPSRLADDLPLFAAARGQPPPKDLEHYLGLASMLDETEPDTLTPRSALELVYAMKDQLAAGSRDRKS